MILMKKGVRFLSAVSAMVLTIPYCVGTNAFARDMDAGELWDMFIDRGLSEAGTAGVIANLQAESALSSHNLQNVYEDILGMSDWEYVAAVDSGAYSYDRFVYDEAGFGLPQFTYFTRKANFLDAAQNIGCSIENPNLQVEFIMDELMVDYPGLLNVLRTTDDVYEAASRFMKDYEQPADTSDSAVWFRYEIAQSIFNSYSQGLWHSYTPLEPVYNIPDNSPSLAANIGDIVMFNGTNHHYSAWDQSGGSYCGSGAVQITDVCPASPYSLHAVAVDGSSSDCWGWISGSEISYDIPQMQTVQPAPVYTEPKIQQSGTYNVGDVVMFNGNTHHLSAFDSSGGSFCTSGAVQITDVYYDGTYQYHAVGVDGSSCWGWVSAYDLSPMGSAPVADTSYTPAPAVQQSGEIQIGSTVYFHGGGHYAWSGADEPAGYPTAGTAIVTDIDYGSAHPYHVIHSDGESWVYGYCNASSLELLY